MEARDLFEWAVRAEVRHEMEVDGYGAVDPRLFFAMKRAAEAVMKGCVNAEGVAAGLVCLKEMIEEKAAKAQAERGVSAFSQAFGFDPMANFPKVR